MHYCLLTEHHLLNQSSRQGEYFKFQNPYSNTIDIFSSIHKEGFERDLNAVYHFKFPEIFLAVEIPSRVFFIQRFSELMRYYVGIDIL